MFYIIHTWYTFPSSPNDQRTMSLVNNNRRRHRIWKNMKKSTVLKRASSNGHAAYTTTIIIMSKTAHVIIKAWWYDYGDGPPSEFFFYKNNFRITVCQVLGNFTANWGVLGIRVCTYRFSPCMGSPNFHYEFPSICLLRRCG